MGQSATVAGSLTAVTSFVGRRREIRQVRAALSTSRLVTLTGVGGVGKTRLAVEAAAETRRTFPDGVWLVDLAPVAEDALVARTVATALGVRDRSARPATEQLVEYLAERHLLIVLDNCEHLPGGCAAVVDELLRSCARLRVLATSRRSLGIGGEHVVPVPPLSLPPVEPSPPLAALAQYEAVGLLVERAAAVSPGFAVTERNRDAVARLCAALDGLPLAIELAATRLRTLSVQEMNQRLADRFGLLSAGSPVVAPRQRTLRGLIDWSHELCSPEERRLWARLSVFSGGFDLDAAEAVCDGDGLDRARILDLLDHLVAQSIVVRADGDEVSRFRMLETIREYGRERLAELGEQDRLRERHRAYFLEFAQRSASGWAGPGQEEALARLRADHGNLRTAFDQCLAGPAGPQAALALCAALCWHWCADGFLSEGRGWLDLALDLATEPTGARAEALWVCAWVSLLQGDGDAAAQRLDECRRLSADLGDRAAAAHTASLEASRDLFDGRVAESIGVFREAAAALDDVGDTAGSLMAMFQLANAYSHRGENDTAAAVARRAIAKSEGCGDRLLRSYALWALAFDTWLRGDAAEARRLVLSGLGFQAGFRDSVGAALMIETLAWVAGSAQDHARAASLLGAAHSIWRSLGTDINAFGPELADHHVACERQARRALRDPAFRAAFERGLRPTVEEAIGFAGEQPPAPEVPGGPEPALTRRELEIAALVAGGLTNRAIAERLVVSPRTVDGHVQNALTKLGFTSRSQLAAWVAEHAHGERMRSRQVRS